MKWRQDWGRSSSFDTWLHQSPRTFYPLSPMGYPLALASGRSSGGIALCFVAFLAPKDIIASSASVNPLSRSQHTNHKWITWFAHVRFWFIAPNHTELRLINKPTCIYLIKIKQICWKKIKNRNIVAYKTFFFE